LKLRETPLSASAWSPWRTSAFRLTTGAPPVVGAPRPSFRKYRFLDFLQSRKPELTKYRFLGMLRLGAPPLATFDIR
jgi:hypothetical protein